MPKVAPPVLHTLVVGESGSGKTTWAKNVARSLKLQRKILVLTPYSNDPTWQGLAHGITNDPLEYRRWFEEYTNALMVIDECVYWSQDKDAAKLMDLISTNGRHRGNIAFYLMQRWAHVSPTVRSNCSNLALFAGCSLEDCKYLGESFPDELIKSGYTMKHGEMTFFVRYRGCWKTRLFESAVA